MDNKQAAAVLRSMTPDYMGNLGCSNALIRGANSLEMLEWLMNPYVMFALVNSYSNTIGTPPDSSTFRAFCEARFCESKGVAGC